MQRPLLLTLLAFFVLASLGVAQPLPETLITLPTGGQVQGQVFRNPATPTHPAYTSRTWRGIPFAEPPTGNRRWTDASPKTPWKGIWDATQDAPGCIQTCHLPPNTCPPTTSEDCLYLNVYAPRDARPSSRLPVIVYFHGGNMIQGYAGGRLYDGSFFANSTSTIVVTTNYRLGLLGFLANNALDGNFGFHDQQLALSWVNKNIVAFGGDPNAVTLAGQSAGAVSVTLHLLSPKSQPMFRSAIVMSDPFSLKLRTASNWQLASNVFCESLGCAHDDTACLRAIAPEVLAAAEVELRRNLEISINDPLSAFMPFTPVIGGAEFPKQPFHMFQDGDIPKDKPIMFGATSEEIYVFVYEAFQEPLPEWKYDILLAVIFGLDRLGPLLGKYPVSNPLDCRDDASYLASDGIFLCPTRNVTAKVSQFRPRDTYNYVFDHLMSFAREGWGPDFRQCWDRVCHGAELPFAFHAGTPDFFNFTPAEERLSQTMVNTFANFARTGSPNGGGVGFDWKSYSVPTRSTAVFSVSPPSNVRNDFRKNHCDFWDEIGYRF